MKTRCKHAEEHLSPYGGKKTHNATLCKRLKTLIPMINMKTWCWENNGLVLRSDNTADFSDPDFLKKTYFVAFRAHLVFLRFPDKPPITVQPLRQKPPKKKPKMGTDLSPNPSK